jgi:hypothetical protein
VEALQVVNDAFALYRKEENALRGLALTLLLPLNEARPTGPPGEVVLHSQREGRSLRRCAESTVDCSVSADSTSRACARSSHDGHESSLCRISLATPATVASDSGGGDEPLSVRRSFRTCRRLHRASSRSTERRAPRIRATRSLPRSPSCRRAASTSACRSPRRRTVAAGP